MTSTAPTEPPLVTSTCSFVPAGSGLVISRLRSTVPVWLRNTSVRLRASAAGHERERQDTVTVAPAGTPATFRWVNLVALVDKDEMSNGTVTVITGGSTVGSACTGGGGVSALTAV